MKLNTLTLDEAALRADLSGDDIIDFAHYDHEDFENDFYIQQVTDLVSGLLNSGNAALAGTRENVMNGSLIEPDESIWMIYSADSDGSVGGYHFNYNLYGARRLEIPSRYTEARDLRGDHDGVEGVVEIAHYIVALVNAAIDSFNEFVAGVAA